MQTHRDAIRASLSVIKGRKPTPPPAPTMRGWMLIDRDDDGGRGPCGSVEITPRSDGSYIVRPVREHWGKP